MGSKHRGVSKIKRKSPIHHTVKRHRRGGKWIESFERGSGKGSQRVSRVVSGKKNESKITSIIKNLVSTRGKSPCDINRGECENFAMDVIEAMGGESGDLYELCTENFDPEWLTDLPTHVWVFYKGRHYDAETPKGVGDWRELPAFVKSTFAKSMRVKQVTI